jgi:BirA family biotin operon repressor/biotin-[acetyl-CoA-carboxylase] ligase
MRRHLRRLPPALLPPPRDPAASSAPRLAVIGVGLNVLPLPPALAADLALAAACVREIDAAATAPSTLARVALPLLAALREFERDGYAAFAARFAARDLLHGRAVATTHPDVPAGIARGVD